MTRYEGEDDTPRYGRRLSPQEQEAQSDEQGDPAAGPDDAPHGASGSGRESTAVPDPFIRVPGRQTASTHITVSSAPLPARTRAGSGGSRGSWRMLVIGLVLATIVPLSLVLCAALSVFGGSYGPSSVLGEAGTVYLEQGGTFVLYGSAAGQRAADCSVTAPDGGAVDVKARAGDMDGLSYDHGSFEASRTGVYTVSCSGGTSGMVVGPPLNLARLPLAIVVLLAAGVSGLIGLVMAVFSAVGLIRARSRR